MTDQDGKPLAGAVFFAVIAAALLCGAYVMWPPDFFNSPYADMTPAMLLRAAASAVLAFVGIEFAFAFAIVTQADR